MISAERLKILHMFLEASNNVGDVDDIRESFEREGPSESQRAEWKQMEAQIRVKFQKPVVVVKAEKQRSLF